MDIFALHLYLGAVVEATIVSTEEEYIIFDRGGAVYAGEIDHGLNPPVSIHVPRWCVMDCPVQLDIVMEIMGVRGKFRQKNQCPVFP